MFPTFRILPLALVMSTALALLACDRDEAARPTAPPAPAAPDYTPLTVGSYWVYEIWQTAPTPNGPLIRETQLDSTVVVGDTVVRGQHYAVISREGLAYHGQSTRELWRDSADYLVNDHGVRLFSATDFAHPLRYKMVDNGPALPADTLQIFQMAHRDSVVSVPAITTPTYDYQSTVNPRVCSAATVIPNTHQFYAPGIGLIKETAFYCTWSPSSGPHVLERRLLRYRIAP